MISTIEKLLICSGSNNILEIVLTILRKPESEKKRKPELTEDWWSIKTPWSEISILLFSPSESKIR